MVVSHDDNPNNRNTFLSFPLHSSDEQSSLVGGGNNECNLMVDTESIHLSDIDCQSYDNSYHDNLYETYSTDHQDQQNEPQYEPATPQQKPGKEIIYKSSKEMYKAVAKECGITCKMSDQCRCYDCQSRYFDCEYEQVIFVQNYLLFLCFVVVTFHLFLSFD